MAQCHLRHVLLVKVGTGADSKYGDTDSISWRGMQGHTADVHGMETLPLLSWGQGVNVKCSKQVEPLGWNRRPPLGSRILFQNHRDSVPIDIFSFSFFKGFHVES